MDDPNVQACWRLLILLLCDWRWSLPSHCRTILSPENPYFYEGKYARARKFSYLYRYIWPIALSIQGLTTTDKAEKKFCWISWLPAMVEQVSCTKVSMDDPTNIRVNGSLGQHDVLRISLGLLGYSLILFEIKFKPVSSPWYICYWLRRSIYNLKAVLEQPVASF